MKKIGILLILTAFTIALTMALAGCGAKEATTSQSSTTPTATETRTSASSAVTTPPTEQSVATEPPTTQPEGASTQTQPSPAEEAATTSPQEPLTPQAPTVQLEDSDPGTSNTDPSETFSKSIEALQSLTSYRYTTTMKYEATGDSAADSGTVEVHGEYSAPDQYHLTVHDSSEAESSEFVKIGNSLWVRDGQDWTKVPDMAVPAMSQSIFSFGLSYVWGNLAESMETGSNFVGDETVNGVKCRHYSSTNSDWEKEIKEGFQNAHGDVWVAEAGYPVKFVFTASGTDEDGNSGSMEWRSDVTDVNSEVSISAPTLE